MRPTKEQFELFQRLISDSSGFYLDASRKNALLASLLSMVKISQHRDFQEYYHYLKFHPQGPTEVKKLINQLTVNETHFFRYREQLKILNDHILPELTTRRSQSTYAGQPSLAVWSAGCASGDEPYSIAISLLDVFNPWRPRNVEILGTDINDDVLNQARNAIYGQKSIQSINRDHRKKYFELRGGKYKLSDKIKNMVYFKYHNLVQKPYPLPRCSFKWDIIFCRNVLIYFKKDVVRDVIGNIYSNLSDGGYLFLSGSETLLNVSTDFSLIKYGETFVYRKTPQNAVDRAGLMSKTVVIKPLVHRGKCGL